MKILKTTGKILLCVVTIALIAVVAVLLFLFVCPSVGTVPDRNWRKAPEHRSDHCADGSFRNENETSTMTGQGYPASDRRIPETKIKARTPAFLSDPQEDDLSFTWFGHSSFLLQIGKINVLVDPVMSRRCSPVSFAGPKRFSELPLTAEELPRIDVLFLSHDHYDHLDYETIRTLKNRVGTFLVPLGVDAILTGWGVDAGRIRALDWWESAELGGVTCTLTPSQHFTGRNPLRRNRTLWGGLYADDGRHRVYYTGDGGYYGVFRRVGERLGAPDLMIAECGQYDPAWAKVHMFPEESAKAGLDAGARWVVPVHWGSFSICNHAWDDPIRRFTAAAEASGLRWASPQIGQTVNFRDIARYTEPWWEGA